MEIKLKNCNNIDCGKIVISEDKLNIKYGINGTGKSTISRAIECSINNEKDLLKLTPFKYLESEDDKLKPIVTGAENLNSVLVFNEEYISRFIYRENELIENSFDIFINTPSYKAKIKEIESIISSIKQVFREDEDLDKTIEDMQELSKSFNTTKTGIAKTSKFIKALGDGNKLEKIPERLKAYSPYLKNEKNVSWLDWQMKGNNFSEISDDCPYCASPVASKREQIQKISKEYNKTTIRNLNIIIKVIERLGDYFSDTARETLSDIATQKDGLAKEDMDFLYAVKQQIDTLIDKLQKLKFLSATSFEDSEKASEKLETLKIKIDRYDRLRSNKTEKIINQLNNSLDEVINKAGKLQGEINKQKQEIRDLIQKYKSEINQFLKDAGYKYEIIIDRDDDFKLKIQHVDYSKPLSGGNQHLSFGEKNAFALVLFMYECLSKKPNLIILDDPISSFDKNKKHAIMNMLFRGRECLKCKTVLMLTHDFEPIIDTIKVLKEFGNLVEASFLNSNNGTLNEKPIKKSDILTFSQICKKIIKSDVNDIIKLIYLRRNYEINDELGNEYQVLSNLFHKRAKTKAEDHRQDKENIMSDEDFEEGVNSIKREILNFDYEETLEKVCDNNQVKEVYQSSSNGYEKLQLFRIFNEDSSDELNSILIKFINESYHIENELICQLNPADFDFIPKFIIDECDSYIL